MAMRRAEKFSGPWPSPVHKLGMTSLVWNTSIGQLGFLSGCAPSQLLHTCSLAEYGRLEEVLHFITPMFSVVAVNILFVLNPKHSSYWEEN